jgi:hypothetical protein
MNIKAELAAMEKMTTGELVERYAALTGQPVRTRHRAYLIRKIAWRLQANAEGDLSERARRRAAQLADDADVRLMPPKGASPEETAEPTEQRTVQTLTVRDPRIPAVGTAITRQYKGRTNQVLVLPNGFEFEGRRYRTLSAVAKEITGSHWNGFRFFRLGAER